jgi:hypothetical protein
MLTEENCSSGGRGTYSTATPPTRYRTRASAVRAMAMAHTYHIGDKKVLSVLDR